MCAIKSQDVNIFYALYISQFLILHNMNYYKLLLIGFVLINTSIHAQSIDGSYSPVVKKVPFIRSIQIQKDNKVLVNGHFSLAGNERVNPLVRFNPDWTIDNSFKCPDFKRTSIDHLEVLANGKIIMRDVIRGELIALNEDGSEDATFYNEISDYHFFKIFSLDTSLLVFGRDQTGEYCLFKLNQDGTIDNSFEKSCIDAHQISGIIDVKTLIDGRLVVIGNFTAFANQLYNRIVLLHPNGTIDNTFDPGSGIDEQFSDGEIEIHMDKILIAGRIASYNNTEIPLGYFRLHLDGRIDESFDINSIGGSVQGSSFSSSSKSIKTDSNNRIFISGYSNGPVLLRLENDGTVDQSFNIVQLEQEGASIMKSRILVSSDGIIVSGNFSFQTNSNNIYSLVKINDSGFVYNEFDIKMRDEGVIYDAAVTTEEKLIVAGDFIEIGDHKANYLAKLNIDGSLDTSFNPNIPRMITTMELSKVNGDIFCYTYLTRTIQKLTPSGEVISSYSPSIDGYILSMESLDNGKLIVGGAFNNVNSHPQNGIARINLDGSTDLSFNTSNVLESSSAAYCIEPNQETGELFIGGRNSEYYGRLILTDSLCNLVSSFNNNETHQFDIRTIKKLNSNKMVFGGVNNRGGYIYGFKTKLYQSDAFGYNIDNSALWAELEIKFAEFRDIYRIDASSIIVGGKFDIMNGFNNSGLCKVNVNGVVDRDYAFNVNGSVNKILKSGEEHIYVLGNFKEINGKPNYSIARINLSNYIPEYSTSSSKMVMEDSILNFSASDLNIYDEDDSLSEMSIDYLSGNNYDVVDNKVVPDAEFVGTINVNANISDGKDTILVSIPVTYLEVNDAPIISSLKNELTIYGKTSFSINMSNFEFEDPDTSMEKIELIILDGEDYWVEGNVVNVQEGFKGELTINVQAFDGESKSNIFSFEILVFTITGMEDNISESFEIFPNPTNDVIYFNGDLVPHEFDDVRLSDLSGKHYEMILEKTNDNSGVFTMDVSSLKAGIYIIHIGGNEEVITKKIVIK